MGASLLQERPKVQGGSRGSMKTLDYYEFLQISPNADMDTIHRVYRFLATRYHPDHPETGNADKFHLLRTAYDVLADPDRRAEYDAERENQAPKLPPLSTSIDFMDSLDGELNRRLAVLAVLYFRRRGTPYAPEVALAEIEARMGFPRDYLDFTMWYLQKKNYVTRADNSDFTLTAAGVDFVETQRADIPVLNKLLTTGGEPSAMEIAEAVRALESHSGPIIVPPAGQSGDRRISKRDRRVGAPDPRIAKIERRNNLTDRRAVGRDRRSPS
jgi:curved DNA-binding protein